MRTVDPQTKIALNNILYATDFSPAAEEALPLALDIARRYDSKIFGVNVRQPQMYATAPPEAWPALEEAWEEQKEVDTQRLDQKLRGVEHEAMVLEGNTWEVISGIIKDNDIDLLIVGTRGRSGMQKALIGSVAEEIFRRATCPVITVGPRATNASAFAITRILFATDFSAGSLAAAPYAVSLAQENQATLELLHVIGKEKVGDLLHPQEFVTAALHRLHSLVPEDARIWCQANCAVEEGEAAGKILEVAKRNQADLIVLGVNPSPQNLRASTHLPWSIAHKVVSQASCPVLTVRG